jgi:hypothetical protein
MKSQSYFLKIKELERANAKLLELLRECGEKLVMIDNLMPELMLEDLIVDIAKELIDENL